MVVSRMLAVVGIAIGFSLLGCNSVGPKQEVTEYDAIVDSALAAREANVFPSLQAAIDSVPENRELTEPYRILLKAGVYHERVVIQKANLLIEGEGADASRIEYDLYAGIARKYHRKNWGTAGSATVTINAENVTLKNLTIENTFDYLANDALPKGDAKRVRHSQGVALHLDEGTDKILLEGVTLAGYQDTLFANGKRAWIRNATISGNVDFIFGPGQVLIEDSTIISRKRGKSFKPGQIQGHITAPSTNIDTPFGLIFKNCKLQREDGVADQSHSLGRPWHPTTTFPDGRYADPDAIGYALYVNCYMDAHIIEYGWESMGGTARDGTKSMVFTPADSRFYELSSRGPGAKKHDVRKALEDPGMLTELENAFFSGWIN